MLDDNLIHCNIKHQLKYIYLSHSTVQHFKIHQKHSLTFETQNCWFRCDVLEANDDKTETKSPALQPNENTLSGTVTTNGNPEKMEPEKGDDDPKKSSEASANKLEMFQEKQKFIEEQNRKRKEMLSKVNLKLRESKIILVSQAILDRQKQTDQESRKLQIVQVKWKWLQIVVMDANGGDGCK